jgi:hypothetical protein
MIDYRSNIAKSYMSNEYQSCESLVISESSHVDHLKFRIINDINVNFDSHDSLSMYYVMISSRSFRLLAYSPSLRSLS